MEVIPQSDMQTGYNFTAPTGEGEVRTPESAPMAGSPLPGRVERAMANNAKADLGHADPADNAGDGTVDMRGSI